MKEEFFEMNGYQWCIVMVNPNSDYLVDRTGKLTVATTDLSEMCVYLSSILYGSFLITVLIHELGHCALFSYGLLDDIHRMVKPEYWIEAEEFICNFIADYGIKIFRTAYNVLGIKAWELIPKEMNLYFRKER